MRLVTLFWAYREAMAECRQCAYARPQRNFGIAVDRDPSALRWQRYDRLAGKIQKRMISDMQALEQRVKELEEAANESRG